MSTYDKDKITACVAEGDRAEFEQFQQHLRSGGRFCTETMSPRQQELYQKAKLTVGVPADGKSPADIARQAQRQEARQQFLGKIGDVITAVEDFFFACRCGCHRNGAIDCEKCTWNHQSNNV